MKSFLLSAGLLLLTYQLTFAQNDTRIGGKLMYGSEIETFGIGATAEIPILDKLVIAPDIGFYFPKKEHGIKTNVFELNGNVNYYFVEEENIGFYGLGGLNYTHVKAKIDNDVAGFSGSGSNGEVGLNLGAGANFHIGQGFLPFAEIKYVLGDFDQLVIAAGVKFNLD
ncbi:outer membrane beta-barrel protein [Sinomicrobium weinanense]|uniref:Outer membrane beta-barrel protein n=1 Tax=Sinomicrobium weinanense TaxID=2842200 RepID=A0A926Q2Z4_9FLAO|nr:outer membrane beta-barrel protein [Sinomicrobium weinanense]MBC9795205.1 outer membrane beta-barrel protein [Sinomicrobium weinanense]MBU3121982.1 outer membrane beta-barrel protein [Sinomicrobium weinanense]